MPVSIDERLWLNPLGDDQSRASDDVARSSMAALVGRVVGAKPFPETARRLAEMTRMPNARIGNAVRLLETDPGLSARLLRLVNSPGYALRMRCTSLRHAAALVGLERLNHIATTAAVLDMFSDSSEVATRLLDHSTVVGAFCRYFAVSFSLPAEELFTCGFLHDIGKLLMLEAEGSHYAELLESAPPHHSHEKERERFGFDHASLGAHVLSAWNIPEPVPLVVAWHHDASRVYEGPIEVAAMIETLRLADDIAHVIGTTSDDRAIRMIAESEGALRLNLGRYEISRLWPELRSLREHCRAQRANPSHFIDVTSIRPTASLPPPSVAPAVGRPDLSGPAPSRPRPSPSLLPASEPARARPGEPACSACSEPSEGELCGACGAPVCATHKDPRDGWCQRCLADFETANSALGAGLALKLGLGAAFLSLLLGTLFGALQNGAAGAPGTLRLLLAPVVALALSAAVLVLGQRWIVRRRFLKQRSANRYTLPSPGALPKKRDDSGIARVLTIPPSAYDKLPLLRDLPLDVVAPASRGALLGSSPPPESVGPLPAAAPRPLAEPIRITEAAVQQEPEPAAPLPAIAIDGAPLQTLRAIEPRPEFNGARTPRRGPRRDRAHRRRAR
jgi:HD-like signal output (HDOD) protein